MATSPRTRGSSAVTRAAPPSRLTSPNRSRRISSPVWSRVRSGASSTRSRSGTVRHEAASWTRHFSSGGLKRMVRRRRGLMIATCFRMSSLSRPPSRYESSGSPEADMVRVLTFSPTVSATSFRFCAGDMCSYSASSRGRYPTGSGTSPGVVSSTSTLPEAGRLRPRISSTSLVRPESGAPSNRHTSPGSTSRSTPLSTCSPLCQAVNPRHRMADMVSPLVRLTSAVVRPRNL